MFPTNFRLFLFAFFLFTFDFCCAYPTTNTRTSSVYPGHNPTLAVPANFTTTERINTGIGTFLRICNITLTPIIVHGKQFVREERTCVVKPENGNGDESSALPPPASTSYLFSSTSTEPPSSTAPPESTITNPSPPPSSVIVPPPVVSVTLTSVPQPSDTASPPPSSTSSGPVDVIGTSSVPRPTDPPPPGNTNSLPDTLPSPTASTPLGQESPTPSPTPFEPPGKKLEVLPIGLGVFAGVSVIALFVVGIVTWERTKHRRNFRKLKTQEANNRMGYGTA